MTIKNADMPAMPLTDEQIDNFGSVSSSEFCGLTKRETFVINAPAMPSWFDIKFSIGEIDDSIDIEMDETDLSELAFMAWPVYYADALLAELNNT
jgi:hypothetical protein